MLLVHITYKIITPESAENGEAAESGFVSEDLPLTFRELVCELELRREPSCSGAPDTGTWFTSYPDPDYQTGSEETTSIHYSRANKPRSAKYWAKAARVAARRYPR